MPAAPPFLIVAIDGGAAAGKSSTARALSDKFHLLHADTGSYFRGLTAEMLRRGVAARDLPAVRKALGEIRLTTRVAGRSAHLRINGREVGDEIRSGSVNAAVSHFAAIPELRSALVAYERGQKEVAQSHAFRGLVMDGRDIGSVIFPQADLRFYLHADPAERARRRAVEGQADAVAERDRLDSSRATAPLSCPPGAISIDSTHLSLEEVVDRVSALVAERLARS